MDGDLKGFWINLACGSRRRNSPRVFGFLGTECMRLKKKKKRQKEG